MAKGKLTLKKKPEVTKFMVIWLVIGIAIGFGLHLTFAASKPGSTSSSSIKLNQTGPTLGSNVTFTVTYPKLPGSSTARIQISCSQAGVVTWATAGNYSDAFKLGGDSSQWKTNGGSANCDAVLYYFTNTGKQEFHSLAATSFIAN